MSQKNNKNKTSNVNVPNYTNEQKQEMRKKMEEVKSQKRRYQIVIGILAVISIAITLDYMIEMIPCGWLFYRTTSTFFPFFLQVSQKTCYFATDSEERWLRRVVTEAFL